MLEPDVAAGLGVIVPPGAGAVIIPPQRLALHDAAQPDGFVVESRFSADGYTVTVTVGDVVLVAAAHDAWPRGSPVSIDVGAIIPITANPDVHDAT